MNTQSMHSANTTLRLMHHGESLLALLLNEESFSSIYILGDLNINALSKNDFKGSQDILDVHTFLVDAALSGILPLERLQEAAKRVLKGLHQ